MNSFCAALIVTLGFVQTTFAETDSNGTPLVLRETGVLYDEYGPVMSGINDPTPRPCTVEMYQTYYRMTPGMGLTLTDRGNAERLHALNHGNSIEELTLFNFAGAYLAALPLRDRTGAVGGRQIYSGIYFGDARYGVDYLNVFTFRAGSLSEYEMREIAPDENPAPTKQFEGRARAATLRTQRTEWGHHNYYLYGICHLRADVS